MCWTGRFQTLRAGGAAGRAGQELLAPAQAALHFSCSAATEILESPKRKANIFESGLQQEPNLCEVIGCGAQG